MRKQLSSLAVFAQVASLLAFAETAEAADPCRDGSRAASTAAQDYRQIVQKMFQVCGTEQQDGCVAARSEAEAALRSVLDAHAGMIASCTFAPPPPDPSGIQPGEVVITEIMGNPFNVNDAAGEWFEIRNLTDRGLNLSGLRVVDDVSDSFTITDDVVVPADGFAVLGVNGNPNVNGGVLVNYVYSNFEFQNVLVDVIAIYNGTTLIDRLSFASANEGQSLSLDPLFQNASANDDLTNWCSLFGPVLASGDIGSPGEQNPSCP